MHLQLATTIPNRRTARLLRIQVWTNRRKCVNSVGIYDGRCQTDSSDWILDKGFDYWRHSNVKLTVKLDLLCYWYILTFFGRASQLFLPLNTYKSKARRRATHLCCTIGAIWCFEQFKSLLCSRYSLLSNFYWNISLIGDASEFDL